MIKPAQALIDLLLTRRGDVVNGLPVDKLEHSLQTAFLIKRHFRLENEWVDQQIVMGLFHDVMGGISPANHGAVIAEVMKPWLSDMNVEILRYHEDFQIKNSHNVDIRGRYAHYPWYERAVLFVDLFDWPAFSPNLVGVATIEDFLPHVERVIK